MLILNEFNKVYSIDSIPSHAEDLRYCILDYTNSQAVDYYCIPLVFLETCVAPSADIQIGSNRIQIPLDWSILVGDVDGGDLEMLSVMQCLDKDFHAFTINPLSGYRYNFKLIEVMNIYPDVKWCTPKLKNGHVLSLPLSFTDNPECCFVAKDVNKLPDTLDISKLI